MKTFNSILLVLSTCCVAWMVNKFVETTEIIYLIIALWNLITATKILNDIQTKENKEY